MIVLKRLDVSLDSSDMILDGAREDRRLRHRNRRMRFTSNILESRTLCVCLNHSGPHLVPHILLNGKGLIDHRKLAAHASVADDPKQNLNVVAK